MTKYLLFSLYLTMTMNLTAGIVWGYNPDTDGAVANVEIHVVDERSVPVPNANVTAAFYYNDNNSKNISGLSDTNGIFAVECMSNWEAKIYARKSGYYSTSGMLHFKTAPYEQVKKTHKWSDGPVKSEVVLKRIVNPQNVKWLQDKDYVFPVTNQVVGFDLKMDDWCKPYGRGEYDDLQFKADIWRSPTNWFQLYAKLEISMTNCVDGFYWQPVDDYSIFRYAHNADTNAVYSKSAVFERDRRGGKKYTTRIDFPNDKFLVFRTRTKLDENGNLAQATYGFIGEGLWFMEKVRFAHILNPIVNDTNLELNITPPNQ